MEDLTTTAAETGRNEQEIEAIDFAPDHRWCAEFEKQLTSEVDRRPSNYARPARSPWRPPVARSTTTTRASSSRTRSRHVERRAALGSEALHAGASSVARDPVALGQASQARGGESARCNRRRHRRVTRCGVGRGEHVLARRCCGTRVLARDDGIDPHRGRCRQVRLARARRVRRRRATKDDVLALTKMKARTYHNAHIRLKRIVRTLTDHKLAQQARA